MAPEGYELVVYKIYNTTTWVLKDAEGNVLFPLREIFVHVFHVPYNNRYLNKEQEKHSTRLRMISPRAPKNQTQDVTIFGDLWCIKNLIRTRIRLNQNYEQKGRDMIIEEFARYWGFNVIGFGVLTHRAPQWSTYPFIEQIAIAAEANKDTWLKCVECERYYPHTENFYGATNSTCEKCLGREFKIRSKGAYGRIDELLKKRKRN